MKSLQEQLSGLVYSTDQGKICPKCRASLDTCECEQLETDNYLAGLDGWVKIQYQTKGRKGKGVTLIADLPLAEQELKKLAKELKTKCGTGGAVKARLIEIQGDQRPILQALLEQKGYKLKFIGG